MDVKSPVFTSEAFIEVMKQVDRIADTNLPVLLTGESGTGKALIASTIHQRSNRRDQPFVAVDCGAIPAESLEAELFGYVAGSGDRRALWEEADEGTIFLAHITQMTASLQAKLLRALKTGEIGRVGSSMSQQANVRLIVASDRNVAEEVAAGRFSHELYACFNEASIALPPLRERPEDIQPLAQCFADRVYSLRPSVKFSAEALALLKQYDWPGNIRELENVVVRAAAMCDGTIRVKDLPEPLRPVVTESASDNWVSLSVIEGRYVERVLEHTCGNKQAAARVLAVDRKTLDRMIKRHHIDSNHVKALRAKASSRN
jgi:DNA-binding NtrC family response regulator